MFFTINIEQQSGYFHFFSNSETDSFVEEKKFGRIKKITNLQLH